MSQEYQKQMSDKRIANGNALSGDYKRRQDEGMNKQDSLINQYTGNAGVDNATNQAGTNASKMYDFANQQALKNSQALANQASNQAASNARRSGLSSGASAALSNVAGNQSLENNFSNQQASALNSFAGQQSNVLNSGNNALNAQASQNQMYAGLKDSERKHEKDVADQTIGAVADVTNLGVGLASELGGVPGSDERLKDFIKVKGTSKFLRKDNEFQEKANKILGKLM